jgi:GDP-L-fucose synthase
MDGVITILVTGGYGMVGKSLQKVINVLDKNLYDNLDNYNFIFLSRKDGDLRNIQEVLNLFEKYKPDVVIHLASCVGGVYENMNNNYNFLIDNTRINTNIVDACNRFNVTKLINILSTCIFPDNGIVYPLTSDQLHNGLPHDSNIGYAYSKRVLHLASELLSRNKNNFTVINLTPTNLYGEFDNYNLRNSHVIPALIHKTFLAQLNNTELEINGSGNALRQFLFVDDLSRVILDFVKLKFEENSISCIVSPSENSEISIKSVIETICAIYNYNGKVIYNTEFSDGQYKKTTNDNELQRYLHEFKFTELYDGLKTSILYFVENYNTLTIRK